MSIVTISRLTSTVNVSEPTLPAASLASHVTTVVAIGNVDPEGGVQVGPLTTPTASVAVAGG